MDIYTLIIICFTCLIGYLIYRVDDLFKFLTHWVPDRYGPLGDVSAQGYELIDSDTEWDDDEAKPGQKVRLPYMISTHIDFKTLHVHINSNTACLSNVCIYCNYIKIYTPYSNLQ